ncbi:MAG: hypothetical protein R2741_08460 [Methanolobus sp.]
MGDDYFDDEDKLRLVTELVECCMVEDKYTHYLVYPFEIKPRDFLQYAQSDFEASYDHHLVNCFSNIKRAIECQIDSLLIYTNLYEIAKKKRMGFPTKIKYLNEMGIVSPNILAKINKTRNKLEHEFKLPTLEDVENALDVAYLFIEYTDHYVLNGLYFCSFDNPDEGTYCIMQLDFDNKTLKIDFDISDEPGFYHVIEANLDYYIKFMKAFLSLNK